uniref:ATP dependent RNA helicase DOB1 n=1 Tax=Echinococcus granulosus TaxID=6210 RepID=A0A068WLG8_ECHGR|nr:ATP dependent RNA helicase DOB1 [Echinococcus granulosus]
MSNLFGIELEALVSAFQTPESPKVFGTMPATPSTNRPAAPFPTMFPLPKTRKSRYKLPKLKTISIPTEEGCLHEVVLPVGLDHFNPLRPMSQTPAKTYTFRLDPFQRQAILCVENDQSVLVSAHTSAGKTVVAEYAIARGLANRQRVIYTTPIKALSNQKFREFLVEFKDVGLMTGDITINPESTLLIMTTEILRSMLYRGSEVTRELGWVIFDEIHYMRERERGVVWEESIILLPDSVSQVFLSATIPNARQFAEWVAFLHRRPCHVIYTDYRPTPLQHYVFPCGGDGIFLVVNQKREFLEANFNSALDVIRGAAGNAQSDTAMRGRRGGSLRAATYCYKLVKLVMDQELEPLIVFSFSKKDCEFYASQLSQVDFNGDKDKAAVDLIVRNALESLSPEDQKLPQILSTVPILRRGIGFHHGGLLPILKEIVEILFAEGYLKVLFATETFAMGLNMPARTVLFTATRKFDGQNFRHISPGEYIQMSGRAGRRGKDDRGTVILMLDDTVTPDAAKQLLLGMPDPLNSAFTLSYNMVLNLLLVEDINPQIMLEKSFFQFQNYASIPALERKIASLDAEFKGIELPEDVNIEQLSNILQLRQGVETLEREKWQLSMKFKYVSPFLQPGRLLRVESADGVDYGWAIVLNLRRFKQRNPYGGGVISDTVMVDVLVRVATASPDTVTIEPSPPSLTSFKPLDDFDLLVAAEGKIEEVTEPLSKKRKRTSEGTPKASKQNQAPTSPVSTAIIASVPLDCLREMSSVCLNFSFIDGADTKDPTALVEKVAKLPSSMRLHFWEGIHRARSKLGGELPLIDPVKDMGVKDSRLATCLKNIHLLQARVTLNPLSGRKDLDYLLHTHKKRIAKYLELRVVHEELDQKESLLQLDELHSRKRVLRRLGFSTEDDVIHLKGRIACEISSGDELMLTELLLDGFFSDLSADQIAGALSCFVTEKSSTKEPPKLRPDMEAALNTIRSKARYLATVAEESRLHSGPMASTPGGPIKGDGNIFAEGGRSAVDDYVAKFSGEMMEIVRSWAQGVSFAELCQMTPLFEGNVIRCLRRLEELLRQMHEAAKVAGNADLENKFVKAMTLIKRDIVFAASLYL